MFDDCKKRMNKKQVKWQFEEKYLGKAMFKSEHRWSFDEFMAAAVSIFGICPYRFE